MNVQPNFFEKDYEINRIELRERGEPILGTEFPCVLKAVFRRNENEQKQTLPAKG